MTTFRIRIAALVCVLAPLAAPAAAQAPKGFLNVNAGMQTTSSNVSSTVTSTINLESSPAVTTFTVKPGVSFDVSGGARFGQVFAVGIGFSQFSKAADGNVNARIPSPFFFNQARPIAGTVSGLKRKETAINIELGAFTGRGPIQVGVFAGPTWFQVDQDLVSSVTYSEAYPFDTATFTGAQVQKASASKVGFHALFDIAYMFSRKVGAGVALRFSQANVDLKGADGTTTTVKAGGSQIGFGLRLQF